jgi:predicted XRE-type DNA-binding protein
MSLENTVENLIDALHDAREYIDNLEMRNQLADSIRMAENDLAYQKLRQSEYDTEVHIATHYMK